METLVYPPTSLVVHPPTLWSYLISCITHGRKVGTGRQVVMVGFGGRETGSEDFLSTMVSTRSHLLLLLSQYLQSLTTD